MRLNLFVFIVLLPALLFVSCKKDEPAPPDTLRVAINSPRSIDPNLVTESEGGLIVENCFEGLFVHGPKGEEVRLATAESYEVSEDGKTWTFTIRKDAKWSDGKPVTAYDFEYSWLRLLDPNTAAEYASIMKPIEGAMEFNSGDGSRDDVGIEALDERTFQVTLVSPQPTFKALLAFYSFLPLPKHVVEDHPEDWTKPDHWVSNGPYQLVENTDRVQIVLEKNPHYWAADAVEIDRIQMRIMQDASAQWAAFNAGQLDIVEDEIPPGELHNLWISASEKLQIYPRLGVYMAVMNVEREPFDDPRVRKAFNLAINKSELVKHVTNGGEVPGTGIVPTMLGQLTEYEPYVGGTYDPEEARALLAEAGYPEGKGLPEVTFRYNTNENHKKVAEALQQMWAENLGVQVELANNEWKVYLDQLKAGDYQMGRYGWIADYVDPMTFLDLFEGDNPNNNTQWANDEYDSYIKKARREPDATRRLKYMQKAEEVLMSELPAIPIYYYTQKMVVDPRVKGIEHHLLGVHLYKYMSLD